MGCRQFKGKAEDGVWYYGGVELHGNMTWVGGHLVDAETISQDTGVCDKHMKAIFENDLVIIDDDPDLIAAITWHDFLCLYYLKFSHQDIPRPTDTKASIGEMIFEHGHNYTIVGNVFDNPDKLPKINPYLIVM